eukprot:m.279762 g.279762  ORF g.279762 m.279762 type:complete len:86 (-) comp16323_c11_seq55:123-380(-)
MKRCSNARMVSPRCPIGLWCAFPSNNNSVMTTYGFSEIYHWHFYTIKVTALDIIQEENAIQTEYFKTIRSSYDKSALISKNAVKS